MSKFLILDIGHSHPSNIPLWLHYVPPSKNCYAIETADDALSEAINSCHNAGTGYYLIFLRPDSCHPDPHAHIFSLQTHVQGRFLTLHSPRCAFVPIQHMGQVTLPGRPSVGRRCWRATAPGHGRPRSPNHRRTQGRRGWRTPAPATFQCGPLPSSA